MAWYKNTETKCVAANFLKAGAAILSTAVLFACGGDSGSSSEVDNEDDGREVATLADMGRCTSNREGDTVYVAEKLTDYLCRKGSWIDLSEQDDSKSSSSKKGGSSSSDSEESSSSSSKNENNGDTLVVKKRSILGVAQKGPFKFGSPVYLRELAGDSLHYSGKDYEDEISSNKGDFVIPNVNLNSPYAEVEVRGLYRNEVTGEYSKDSISLFALTDLKTDSRTKVNVNLLTHLEYKRAMYLVRKGYSVYAAKKQADQEIMTAFELPTTVKYSEDLSVFEDSEDDNVDYANASLMMLNLLFLGDRSDAGIKKAIDNFIADIEKDGSWEDDSTKAVMADFAAEIDGDEIRANVKAWNILDIPKFEEQMEMFWNNVYGLGGCTSVRSGVIAQNKNKYSKNVDSYYLCQSSSWKKMTTLEADTYGWKDGETGEVKEGTYTDAKYVYRDKKWTEVNPVEDALGSCTESKSGTVDKTGDVYYICKSSAWEKASTLEYDTYGWSAGVVGEVKKGKVTDAKYVYRSSAWTDADDVESALGSCTTKNAKTVEKNEGTYYACEDTQWKSLTALEADTYGWSAGAEGEVKKGTYTDAKYVYRNSKWNAASDLESALGSCTTKNAGTVSEKNSTYYICKSSSWTKATTLEYDTYGYTCSKDGAVISGGVNANNKYVCDGDSFRTASAGEINLELGCTSYTQGEVIEVFRNESIEEYWICSTEWANKKLKLGQLTDSRDNRVYKTVKIGDQVWMAENLNYDYNEGTAKSYCYKNEADSCAKYGRLYTWAAAMDSAGVFSSTGKGCGFGKTCASTSSATLIRGVCPEGWHLPTKTEWETLFTAVGGISVAGKKLKSSSGWENSGNGTDAYGFSALPAGNRDHYGDFSKAGYEAFFWSASEVNSLYAYYMDLYNRYEYAYRDGRSKILGFSVRCLQN